MVVINIKNLYYNILYSRERAFTLINKILCFIKDIGEEFMQRIIGIYNDITLELLELDIKTNPGFPVVRCYVRDQLVGVFSIETGRITLDNDISKFDVGFIQKELKNNREHYLECWYNYVKIIF